MAIKIDKHLFYINTKNSSLIIEERDGYLLLKHLGRKIESYHFSNTVFERDHAFSGNPKSNERSFSLDTQRQVLGQHGLGDFRQPSLQVQHANNEVTDFRFVESQLTKGGLEVPGLPSPHSTEDAETLAFILEDTVAHLRLTLYYTAFEDSNTIATYLLKHCFKSK